jgi:hypothetical protein
MTKPVNLLTSASLMALNQTDRRSNLINEHLDYVTLIYDGGNRYDIVRSRINSPEKLLGWIRHLSKKGWITTDHIHVLIDAAREMGVNVNMHA